MDNSNKDNTSQPHPSTFVYDGKRMRNLQERRTIDYSSSVIFTKYNRTNNIQDISAYVTPKLERISTNKIKSTVNAIKWTPDGRRLISGTSTGEFTLWNGYSFNFETILQAHESPVRSLCWSPTASFLVSGDTLGIIKYWHPSMSNIQVIQGHAESVRGISFAPFDAKFCSCSDDGLVKVWDSKEAKEETVLKGHGWDVKAAAWHPTKALIASGGKDTTTKLWDPRGKEFTTLHNHKSTVFDLKWSSDSYFLFTASKDQTIKMTDIRNMKVFTYKTNNHDITSLGIHPHFNDLFVSGSATGDVSFYRRFNDEPIKTIDRAHDSIVWSIEYHPLGHVLATGSLDQSVRFWIKDKHKRAEKFAKKEENSVCEDDERSSENIPGL